MDTAQWAQGIGVVKKPMEDSSSSNNICSRPPSAPSQTQQLVERRTRPLKAQAINCPRCNSTNTKFCYYNNYSLTQPRYFCKTCRRYWTEGGSLRNVPVGGGSRKNKRHSSSSSSSSSITTTSTAAASSAAVKINSLQIPTSLPSSLSLSQISATTKPFQGQDLNLAFPNNSFSELIGGFHGNNINGAELSAMELFRSTGLTARDLGPLVQMSMAPETGAVYGAGFGLHNFSSPAEIKFPLDGYGNGNCNANGGVMQGGVGRLSFPFSDMKPPIPMKAGGEGTDQQSRGQQPGDASMFWSTGANLGAGGGSWLD